MNDGMISGSWMNMKTGKIITVVNTVMDGDNNMILMTNKGQMSFEEFSRNYVQCDDTEQKITVPQSQPISDEFLIDDIPISNINNIEKQDIITNGTIHVEEKQQKSNSIIEDIFNKIETKPNIQISLNWDEFPINDIKTLTKYLNLTLEDIASYIVKKYVNNETITLSVKDYLNTLI